MKKLIYSILFIGLFLSSCTDESDKSNKSDKSEKAQFNIVDSDYIVSEGDPFYDIVFHPDGYTLDDLDLYYREVKSLRKNEKNYNNLKKIIINTMFQEKELIGVADKSILEYYTNEIISMPYISNMEMLYFMLEGLLGYWPNEKLSSTAQEVSSRNFQYINENFEFPKAILDKPQHKNGLQLMFNLLSLKTQSFPYSFVQEYEFQIERKSKRLPSSWPTKIKFFTDGTYKRSEFTRSRIRIVNKKPEIKLIYITEIAGVWTLNEGQIKLSDNEIVDFYCKSMSTSSITECNLTPEQIPLGASEWFERARILSYSEGVLTISRWNKKE